MRPFRVVAELYVGPDRFAVLSVDPSKRHEGGGCVAVVLSLHQTREEADRAASGGGE